jgi:hypothetical protein
MGGGSEYTVTGNWWEGLINNAENCSCNGWCGQCHQPDPTKRIDCCQNKFPEKCACDYGKFEGLEPTYHHWMHRYAAATAVMSMVCYRDPNYQALLGMGEAIVPLLLKDIYEDGGWVSPHVRAYCPWGAFSLLRQLVQPESRQPILPDRDRGRLGKIRDMWVKWGQEQGYLPCDNKNQKTENSKISNGPIIAVVATILGLMAFLGLLVYVMTHF